MRLFLALLIVTGASSGCGGEVPTAPSPSSTGPSALGAGTSTAIILTGTITDTVTGAFVGSFSAQTARLPAQVTVSAMGYVTRQTWVATVTPTVDLIPLRGFDLTFYRQFARYGLDSPDALTPLWVLPAAPNFYLEVEGKKGLSRQTAAKIEATARRLVPLLTGDRWHVTRWETGPEPRMRQPGWIMIERRDEADACGRAYVGAPDGLIWLNGDSRLCDRIEAVFAHELGHAFGFGHVDRPGAMMSSREDWWLFSAADGPNEIERHHAALAYARPRGNTDIDVDPRTPLTSTALLMAR
jgi:hypothetical protein